jgi:hypothetical protein
VHDQIDAMQQRAAVDWRRERRIDQRASPTMLTDDLGDPF